MKKILIAIITLIIVSCNTKSKEQPETSKKDVETEKTFIDTLNILYSDTSNLSTSPLFIINTEIGEKNTVLRTPITFTVKNVGNKNIEAVKFRMIVQDAFGETLYELLGRELIYGEARMDEVIKVGQTRKHIETIHYVGDPKKVVKSFPYEIAFSDGTIWKASEK